MQRKSSLSFEQTLSNFNDGLQNNRSRERNGNIISPTLLIANNNPKDRLNRSVDPEENKGEPSGDLNLFSFTLNDSQHRVMSKIYAKNVAAIKVPAPLDLTKAHKRIGSTSTPHTHREREDALTKRHLDLNPLKEENFRLTEEDQTSRINITTSSDQSASVSYEYEESRIQDRVRKCSFGDIKRKPTPTFPMEEKDGRSSN